jgi:hypothetical protein
MSNLLDDHHYIKEEIEKLLDGLNPNEKAFFARQIKEGETDIKAIFTALNDKYREEKEEIPTFEDLEAGLEDHLYVFQINLEHFLTSGNLKVQNDRKGFVRDVIHNTIQGEPEDIQDNGPDYANKKSKQLKMFT